MKVLQTKGLFYWNNPSHTWSCCKKTALRILSVTVFSSASCLLIICSEYNSLTIMVPISNIYIILYQTWTFDATLTFFLYIRVRNCYCGMQCIFCWPFTKQMLWINWVTLKGTKTIHSSSLVLTLLPLSYVIYWLKSYWCLDMSSINCCD